MCQLGCALEETRNVLFFEASPALNLYRLLLRSVEITASAEVNKILMSRD